MNGKIAWALPIFAREIRLTFAEKIQHDSRHLGVLPHYVHRAVVLLADLTHWAFTPANGGGFVPACVQLGQGYPILRAKGGGERHDERLGNFDFHHAVFVYQPLLPNA